MPQMAPAWWTILFFTFILSMLMMFFFLYFQTYYMPVSSLKDKINSNKINWKW